MTKAYRYVCIFVIAFVIFLTAGCSQPVQEPNLITENNNNDNNTSNKLSVYSLYVPTKMDILPLTEIVFNEETQQKQINIFVSLIDQFGSEIKSPCVFRFELNRKVQRSAEPKGSRVKIWDDADLIDPVNNNNYWRNYLRAYEFKLPIESLTEQSYILEITCICPNNKRISSEFILNINDETSG